MGEIIMLIAKIIIGMGTIVLNTVSCVDLIKHRKDVKGDL